MRLLTTLLAAGLAVIAPSAHAAEVTAAVAANFAEATRDIVPLFEAATGHTVKVSLGSTGALFAQIAHGAPFDLFLAADRDRPAKAEAEGWAVPGTRFTYAKGRLVLWSATAGAFQDGEAYVRGVKFSRAAIANPKIAPYGLAARQVLEHLGVWEQAQPKLVRGENIAQTFQFVATGNVDVGFVADSQIRSWKGDPGSLWEIPEGYYTPIAQQAVLLQRGQDNPAARAFLDFLKTPAARQVMTGYGYGVE